MLKFEHWDREVTLQIQGSVMDVIQDISLLIHLVWEDLERRDPEKALRFKHLMQISVEDGSPAWEQMNILADVTLDMGTMALLEMLKRKKESESEEGVGLGMRFEGEPVKADGDCSLEEMTRNAARMAMEKKEAETGESGT